MQRPNTVRWGDSRGPFTLEAAAARTLTFPQMIDVRSLEPSVFSVQARITGLAAADAATFLLALNVGVGNGNFPVTEQTTVITAIGTMVIALPDLPAETIAGGLTLVVTPVAARPNVALHLWVAPVVPLGIARYSSQHDSPNPWEPERTAEAMWGTR